MSAGQKIIQGLKDAVRGSFSRVSFVDDEGNKQVWVRQDAGSPEHLLDQARDTIVEQQSTIDRLIEAIEPFANMSRGYVLNGEHDIVASRGFEEGSHLALLKVGDLRRAKAARDEAILKKGK